MVHNWMQKPVPVVGIALGGNVWRVQTGWEGRWGWVPSSTLQGLGMTECEACPMGQKFHFTPETQKNSSTRGGRWRIRASVERDYGPGASVVAMAMILVFKGPPPPLQIVPATHVCCSLPWPSMTIPHELQRGTVRVGVGIKIRKEWSRGLKNWSL